MDEITQYIEIGKLAYAVGSELYAAFKGLLGRAGLSDEEINAVEQGIIADAEARKARREGMAGDGK